MPLARLTPTPVRRPEMSDSNDTTIPLGFCQCGCGQRTKVSRYSDPRYGYIKDQPRRYLSGHSSRLLTPAYMEQDCGYETPCWIWQRATDRRGYGVGCLGRTPVRAHILYFESKHGPVPDGLQLDHRCRIRRCCNPDHLEAVTSAENTRRGAKAKLSASDIEVIRSLHGKMLQREIAELFNVSAPHINRILKNINWRK